MWKSRGLACGCVGLCFLILKGKIKMENKEQNLTVGSVPQKLIRFAFPLFGANLLQSLYSIIDMLVVGRIVGKNGLAAISNASMIGFIINLGTLFSLSFLAAILVTAAGLLLYAPLFSLLHVPAEAMKDACSYMEIICMGTIFVFGYNAVCSLMKGLGDSKSPLFFVAAAALVNIVLDLLLVGPLGMGTKGAAYATIFSQGVSLIISVVHLKRKRFLFDFKLKSFVIRKDKLLIILKVGLPTAVQMAVVNISYLIITGMLNTFGVSVAAASGIGLKINTFAGMPCWAVGQAVTTMVGQNMGAQNIERVKKTTQIGLLINVCVTVIAVVLVQIFSENMILLFDPAGTEVIREGVMYLRICCSVNSLVYAVMYTFDSFAIGAGAANVAMCNALLDAVVVRLPVCWLLAFPLQIGFTGIYIGQAISPVLPAIAGLVYFAGKKWYSNKLISNNPQSSNSVKSVK